MIRICRGEVFRCAENDVNRDDLMSFFLDDNERVIVQIVNSRNEHVGLVTYPQILESEDLQEVIDRQYIMLGPKMFDEANQYYTINDLNKYCPVLNEKREIEFFTYYETEGNYILSLIKIMRGAVKQPDNLLKGMFDGINIWGLNEMGFRLAEILEERNEIEYTVIGEYWDRLGFKDKGEGKLVEGGFNVYVEGNKALPLSEIGKWRHHFPSWEYTGLNALIKRFNEILNGYNLFNRTQFFVIADDGRQWLYDNLVQGKPFMAARLGMTEGKIVHDYLSGKAYSKEILRYLYTTSGFFSDKGAVNIEDVNKYVEKMKEAVRNTDLHLWLDREAVGVINSLARNDSKISGWGILMHESADADDKVPWLQGLKGKKVLVVSPFEETIKTQYEKRRKVYSGNKALPDFELITYKMIETQNGINLGFRDFFEAYDYVIRQIREIDFDVALISGGAYGYLLANDIKEMGKAAIQLSSMLMPIFGIKIKRHATDIYLNSFWNEYWSFPIDKPIKNFEKVEDGCYWE